MPRYRVVRGIHYKGNGVKYVVGDEIDLPEERAQELGRKLEYVGPVPTKKPPEPEPEPEPEKGLGQVLVPKHMGNGKWSPVDEETGVKVTEEKFDSKEEAQRWIDENR